MTMGHKEKTLLQDREVVDEGWRRFYPCFKRPGVVHTIKTRMSRKIRRKYKQILGEVHGF